MDLFMIAPRHLGLATFKCAEIEIEDRFFPCFSMIIFISIVQLFFKNYFSLPDTGAGERLSWEERTGFVLVFLNIDIYVFFYVFCL